MRLERLLVLGIDERLPDERDRPEQRLRVSVPACRLELHVQRHRRLHDPDAPTRRRDRAHDRRLRRRDDVDERAMAANQDAGRRLESRRDASRGQLRRIRRVRVDVIGGHHVRPQHQVALPPLRLVEGTDRGRLLRRERDVESSCGAHVDQAWIHGGTGAIDHHGVGRRLDVRAHGLNQPVPDDDGARCHGAPATVTNLAPLIA